MSRALDDVIVVDLTRQFCAALSGAFLADFGARVIRLDLLPAARGRHAGHGGWNHEADLIHRNKESLALDPQSSEGKALLQEVVAKADVLITDWQRDELAALGLDYASVAKRRADIIYGRLSGFGPTGPDADLPAIDELAAARTGMMPILPQPGQPPVYTGSGAMHAGVMLAFGVVTALVHRVDSNEGQEVDVSLFGANMYGAALDIQAFLAIGKGDRLLNPISRLDVSNPMSGSLYPSADGRWVTLTMPDTDRWWPTFSQLVGIATDDPRFDTHDKRTESNRLLLIEALEAAFQQQPGTYWRQAFQEKQLSADVIEQFDYPANDPQVAANRYIMELDHPSHGRVKSLGFPIYMSESTARLDKLAPAIGQHSRAVLRDLLGIGEDRFHQLNAAGVVA
ncbi:putative Formyl-CoA transferase [Sterolibacterium denitrificans]|uniref:Formyl-CoA transferase n=1 Tax=Sterolibacterium denitrificans TaxID=157592 RepID=A0A7Z7MUG7_9PROT|nr:CoA transferase [Sterolibacterium denitrificans]SMB22473.1 putative Formyl-CoA transferase [Sterolibacterium denitrificans]